MTSALGEKGKTMADEYINKKDVINLGVLMQTHLWTREQTYNAIFCLPTADVAPVRHGRWAETVTDGFLFVSCSACGFKTGRIDYNYCPNCGAKMDEGGSDGTND